MTTTSLQFSGVSFSPEGIARVAGELQRQKDAKRDYIYPASKLAYSRGDLILQATQAFDVGGRVYTQWDDAEKALDDARVQDVEGSDGWIIKPIGEQAPMVLNSTAASQLATRLDIPAKFIRSLRTRQYDDILDRLFCDLLGRDDRRFLVRTLDGNVRAVLSDKYKVMDNCDLFFAAAERFNKIGAQAWKARLWDDGFELFATAPHIAGEVTLDRTFDPGDGGQWRWHGKDGDVHNPAVRIRNSETGQGGLGIDISILRAVCANFCVWTQGIVKTHVGGKIDAGEGLLKSDRTKELESDLAWSQIRDAIDTAFDEGKFQELINKLNKATQAVIDEPEVAVDHVVASYELAEDRKAQILAQLLSTGDRTAFGLVQAVTATAHDLDKAGDHAGASNLETVGARLADNYQAVLA